LPGNIIDEFVEEFMDTSVNEKVSSQFSMWDHQKAFGCRQDQIVDLLSMDSFLSNHIQLSNEDIRNLALFKLIRSGRKSIDIKFIIQQAKKCDTTGGGVSLFKEISRNDMTSLRNNKWVNTAEVIQFLSSKLQSNNLSLLTNSTVVLTNVVIPITQDSTVGLLKRQCALLQSINIPDPPLEPQIFLDGIDISSPAQPSKSILISNNSRFKKFLVVHWREPLKEIRIFAQALTAVGSDATNSSSNETDLLSSRRSTRLAQKRAEKQQLRDIMQELKSREERALLPKTLTARAKTLANIERRKNNKKSPKVRSADKEQRISEVLIEELID
jgi:hypothetical protein